MANHDSGVSRRMTIGVDTHRDTHHAAAVDDVGRVVGSAEFAANPRGYDQLLRWVRRFGEVAAVGVEGTGAYGAGLMRHLRRAGVHVIEVDRPDRKLRRAKGKSDPVDAEAAARAVLAGTAIGIPKHSTGVVESIRALRVARRTAVKARTQVMNQLHALVVTGPEPLRSRLRGLSATELVRVTAAARPGGDLADSVVATKTALRLLARRHQQLSADIADLDALLQPLVAATAPRTLAMFGAGVDVVGQLLVTAGENPQRLASEAAFARLCGAAPQPASSGKTTGRHRLNRGGDRAANSALHRIVLCRMRWDPATRDYVRRRTAEGLSKPEIMRCLKRYVAREVYRQLRADLDPGVVLPTAA